MCYNRETKNSKTMVYIQFLRNNEKIIINDNLKNKIRTTIMILVQEYQSINISWFQAITKLLTFNPAVEKTRSGVADVVGIPITQRAILARRGYSSERTAVMGHLICSTLSSI